MLRSTKGRIERLGHHDLTLPGQTAPGGDTACFPSRLGFPRQVAFAAVTTSFESAPARRIFRIALVSLLDRAGRRAVAYKLRHVGVLEPERPPTCGVRPPGSALVGSTGGCGTTPRRRAFQERFHPPVTMKGQSK